MFHVFQFYNYKFHFHQCAMYCMYVLWLFHLPTPHVPFHTPCMSNQRQHSQHVGLHWCGVPPSVWYSHGTYKCSFAGSVPSERHHFDTASCIETPLMILNELGGTYTPWMSWPYHECISALCIMRAPCCIYCRDTSSLLNFSWFETWYWYWHTDTVIWYWYLRVPDTRVG